VLRLGAGVALGSLAATSSATASGQASRSGRTNGLPSKASLSVAGQVQYYRSRPDLSPAAVILGMSKPGQAGGLILMDTHAGPGQQGPIILDGGGNLVWFQPVSAGASASKRAMNLQASTYHGQPVLAWWEGAVVYGHGQGHYVIADQSYSEVARVSAGNGYRGDLHEFNLTPQGTALFTCYGTAQADLRSLGGPSRASYFYGVAQEVDVATGKVLFQWRSDQHVSLAESYAPLPKGPGPWDYFHINSIDVANDGNLLIGSRNTWCVYKVDRQTGQVLWRMGGKKSDFSFGPGARFAWQHDAVQQPDGTFTIFDNGAGDYITEKQSRGLVLRLDTAARRVDLVQQYLHPGKPISAGALGSVQPLADGHVFMGWGVGAYFTEFDQSGQALLDGHLAGAATLSYRAFRSSWTGRPKDQPAAAASKNGTGMTVYASWNGATEVSTWMVLAGQHASSLREVGTAPRQGFETAISAPAWAPYVAVVALDARGKQLGRSGVVRAQGG
jgi:hypothetical protein